MSLAFVFPGQGSQKLGMLAEWYSNNPLIRQTFNEASDRLGVDLWAMTTDTTFIDQTQFTQPILLTASIALWRVWQQNSALSPSFLAGHSLGEYSALVAAQALSFSDAVHLVHQRGQLMQSAVLPNEGGMLAIMGLADDVVEQGCKTLSQESGLIVDAANYNAPNQVVIAGNAQGMIAATEYFKANGAKVIPLAVSVPSHCRLMASAADAFASLLDQTPMQRPQLPVIQNVTAQAVQEIEQIKDSLKQQLYSSVRWTQSMGVMAEHGVTTMIECGSGQVLTGLQRRINPSITVHGIDSPSKLEQTLQALV